MELHEVVERLQKEGATPEEILKAIKQRRYMLQKVKEYQKRTYKKITVSVRKSEIEKLKEKFPEIEENYIVYALAIYKLVSRIPRKVWDPLWKEVKRQEDETSK